MPLPYSGAFLPFFRQQLRSIGCGIIAAAVIAAAIAITVTKLLLMNRSGSNRKRSRMAAHNIYIWRSSCTLHGYCFHRLFLCHAVGDWLFPFTVP
jgi:hypothetical protein